jgi:regulatory protein
MSIITSIKQQKDKNRVNIYLDGKFGFGIDLENFVKLNLRVEQELTAKEIEEIKAKANYQKSLNRLIAFASRRPRSMREIETWFKRKEVPVEFHERLINKLESFEMAGDERFARFWVESRSTFRPKSKRVINQELRIKGISKEIIDKVLSENVIDEEKIAKELVAKKMYKWEKLQGVQKRKKISEFLARQGFGWDIIKKLIDL